MISHVGAYVHPAKISSGYLDLIIVSCLGAAPGQVGPPPAGCHGEQQFLEEQSIAIVGALYVLLVGEVA